MTHATIILTALSASFALIVAHALAQEPGTIEVIPHASQAYGWSDVTRLDAGEKIDLVLKSNPAHRLSCQFALATENRIECSSHPGRKPIFYDRGQIAAVIKPRYTEPSFWSSLALLGASGGTITGAVFLARVATVALFGAIPIAAAGGAMVLTAVVMLKLSMHNPDALIYRAEDANVQLART